MEAAKNNEESSNLTKALLKAERRARKTLKFEVPKFLIEFNRKERNKMKMDNRITLYKFLEGYNGKEVYICLKHRAIIGGLNSEIILLKSIKWTPSLTKSTDQAITEFESESGLKTEEIIVTGWDLCDIDGTPHMTLYIDNKNTLDIIDSRR